MTENRTQAYLRVLAKDNEQVGREWDEYMAAGYSGDSPEADELIERQARRSKALEAKYFPWMASK